MPLSKVIKPIIFIILLWMKSLCSSGESGSEWIVSGQQYYKIKTVQDGIYSIPFTQLQNSGINTSNLSNLQLWFRGKEQAIYLNNDSLFFFGKKNDGTLDSLLYPSNFQANKYFNLLSDTCAYFLTFGLQEGKRITPNTKPSTNISDNWYYQESRNIFSEQYFYGSIYSTETHKASYDKGEGWFGLRMQTNGVRKIEIPILNPYLNTTEQVHIDAQVVGIYNNSTHNVFFQIGEDPNNPDYTFSFATFYNLDFSNISVTIPNSYLSGKSILTCYLKIPGPNNDFIAPAYVNVRYPRLYNSINTQNLSILSASNKIRTVSISNVTVKPKIILNTTDIYNQTWIDYTYINNTCNFILTAEIKSLFVLNQPYLLINKIESVDLELPTLADNYFIIYADIFETSAENYKQYRSSSMGGNYDVGKYSFGKLCNIYAYGEFTAAAVKRFADELIQKNAQEKYILILGKGVTTSMGQWFPSINYAYYRFQPSVFWTNADYKNKFVNLVPTFGEPGSDLMFSVDERDVAQIYTGRVPARTNEEVNGYLEKVKAHESLDSTNIWRKNLIHLSGGKIPSELSLYKSYIDNYKLKVEGPYFGGKVVKSFVKNLKYGSIDNQLIANVAEEVNKGISLMTFFGHSSAEINDVDIGFVSNPIYGYKNMGKYPMLLINGCSSADIFSNYSFAEDWINTPNLGAINVLGHTDIGYSNNLNQYSSTFYTFQFNDLRYRNKSIGFIMHKVIDSITTFNSPNDIVSQAHCTQMNLSGDPAIKLYSPSKTDYAIYGDNQIADRNCALISLNGLNVTAKDPFKIIIPVENYGSTTTKTVDIIISRFVNNVFIKKYQVSLSPIFYLDTVSLEISNEDGMYVGENRFEIRIDPLDSLKEIQKDNNLAVLNYYMPLSSVKCLYPLNYSIVSNQPVSLVAQPTNLLINTTEYYFEIDTTKFYNSPFKQTAVITSGSLPTWNPQLLSDLYPSDSIVYFWRARFKNIQEQEDTIWDNSSFVYIKNSNPGWSQSNIHQFLENNLVGLSYSFLNKTWDYPTTAARLRVKAPGGIVNYGSSDLDNTLLSLDYLPILQRTIYNNCVNNGGFFLFILDRSSLTPVVYEPNNNGWSYCGQNYDTKYVQQIIYPASPLQNSSISYIQGSDGYGFINAIQHTNKNDLLVIFSNGYSYKEYWVPELNSYFRDSLHANNIASLTSSAQPFLLITKRELNSPITEKVSLSTDIGTFVSIDTIFNSFYDRGRITTNLIGPTSKWGKMYFAIDTLANDQCTLKLIRYNLSGIALDTIDLPKKDSLDLNGTYLVDGIHVYCKLFLELEDNSTLSPPIIKKWQIIYNGIAEGTINTYALGVDNYKLQTRSEGDSVKYTYQFDNISTVDFIQPIKVVYSIRNESGNLKLDTVEYTPLLAGKNLIFSYTFSTKGLVGKNFVQAYINPQLQPEQYYSNNILETTLIVEADKTQPVLEVAFDGIRIFDGDLVSASPLINISLRDNNKYFLMTDPSSIQVFLQYPGTSNPVEISSTNTMVKSWRLENTKTNTFVAELQPNGLADGTYTIIVQGKDASGNKSGTNQYRISFTVENKPTISYFYPYPNPFSTSCRFVFTLSGTNVPDKLKIQIMTVSGKVVKEIFKEQLGAIHIGNNISDYAWDGTDEFGDRLANGVYLYRVIIKDDSQFFEHRENAGDKAFKHDWGKLYILR